MFISKNIRTKYPKVSRRPSHATVTLQFAPSTFSFVHYEVNIYSAKRLKSLQECYISEKNCISLLEFSQRIVFKYVAAIVAMCSGGFNVRPHLFLELFQRGFCEEMRYVNRYF